MCIAKIIVETEAFLVDDVKEHVETLHGIVRLIIVRVASFRRPLDIFSSTTFIVSAKQNVVRLSLNLLAACPSGRRTGRAVRRFDSLVLSEVPDLVLCLCAQGEGAFLRIAP